MTITAEVFSADRSSLLCAARLCMSSSPSVRHKDELCITANLLLLLLATAALPLCLLLCRAVRTIELTIL